LYIAVSYYIAYYDMFGWVANQCETPQAQRSPGRDFFPFAFGVLNLSSMSFAVYPLQV
jgi:hypothetical protein